MHHDELVFAGFTSDGPGQAPRGRAAGSAYIDIRGVVDKRVNARLIVMTIVLMLYLAG